MAFDYDGLSLQATAFIAHLIPETHFMDSKPNPGWQKVADSLTQSAQGKGPQRKEEGERKGREKRKGKEKKERERKKKKGKGKERKRKERKGKKGKEKKRKERKGKENRGKERKTTEKKIKGKRKQEKAEQGKGILKLISLALVVAPLSRVRVHL